MLSSTAPATQSTTVKSSLCPAGEDTTLLSPTMTATVRPPQHPSAWTQVTWMKGQLDRQGYCSSRLTFPSFSAVRSRECERQHRLRKWRANPDVGRAGSCGELHRHHLQRNGPATALQLHGDAVLRGRAGMRELLLGCRLLCHGVVPQSAERRGHSAVV